MDSHVAHGAGLIFLRLIMERWNCRRGRINRQRMALEAKQIDIAAPQKAGIRGAMGRMACDAPFSFDRGMFKDERSCLVGVTGKTYGVLGSSRTQLSREETAVRIMAVAACDQSLVHTMVIRLGKVRFDFKVAAITQLRLAGLHEVNLDLWGMNRVTIYTSHIVLQVL